MMLGWQAGSFMDEKQIEDMAKILTGFTPEYKQENRKIAAAEKADFQLDNKVWEGMLAIANFQSELDFRLKKPKGTTKFEDAKEEYFKTPEGQMLKPLFEKYFPEDKVKDPFSDEAMMKIFLSEYAQSIIRQDELPENWGKPPTPPNVAFGRLREVRDMMRRSASDTLGAR
jgi:hypothetical protein